jgi:hypothetical protein
MLDSESLAGCLSVMEMSMPDAAKILPVLMI